jgi:hypothetical protein
MNRATIHHESIEKFQTGPSFQFPLFLFSMISALRITLQDVHDRISELATVLVTVLHQSHKVQISSYRHQHRQDPLISELVWNSMTFKRPSAAQEKLI